jgi:hypothetical protein
MGFSKANTAPDKKRVIIFPGRFGNRLGGGESELIACRNTKFF